MLGITEELNRGEMCTHGLVVTKLPSVNGIDVGWGLFTDTDDVSKSENSVECGATKSENSVECGVSKSENSVECGVINDNKVAIRKGAYIGEYLGILYAKSTTPSGGCSSCGLNTLHLLVS